MRYSDDFSRCVICNLLITHFCGNNRKGSAVVALEGSWCMGRSAPKTPHLRHLLARKLRLRSDFFTASGATLAASLRKKMGSWDCIFYNRFSSMGMSGALQQPT